MTPRKHQRIPTWGQPRENMSTSGIFHLGCCNIQRGVWDTITMTERNIFVVRNTVLGKANGSAKIQKTAEIRPAPHQAEEKAPNNQAVKEIPIWATRRRP